jgi:hypothetical protein
MEVTLPRGVALGVEAPNLDKGGDPGEKADRELGRIFLEMFLPVEESTVIVFRDKRQAAKAQVHHVRQVKYAGPMSTRSAK